MSVNGSRSPFDSASGNLYDDWNPEPREGGSSRRSSSSPDSLGWLGPESGPPLPLALPASGPTPIREPEDADFILNEPAAGAITAGPRVPEGRDTAVVAKGEHPVVFPKIGGAIGGFRLISELGRGAFARVYLAHEAALGNRPVALKVSKAEGDEPKILARLQHTHIVPIHSVQDDPATGLRLICMPYFGGANLAQVLEATGDRESESARGRSLIEALDLVGRPAISRRSSRAASRGKSRSGAIRIDPAEASPSVAPGRSLLARIPWAGSRGVGTPAAGRLVEEDHGQPSRRFLRASGSIRAAVWVAARLAEGLEHAHSRGLLHRDLKPSNVLVAADGTPMLLDFNLAADAEGADPEEGARALMGGTLPYMAPEHLDAFNPLGSTPPGAVDERSDLYALGLILFEMVAGRPAFPDPEPGMGLVEMLEHMTAERRRAAPSLRLANPRVPWSLDAIVAKSLAPDPDRRYRAVGELAEDLRRFLDDLPLRFTPEPSVRERLGKWSRRHPKASSAWSIGTVAVILTAIVAGLALVQAGRLREVAARLNLRRFREAFRDCQFLLNTSSGGDLSDHLHVGVGRARAAIERFGVAGRGDWDRGYWVESLAPAERLEIRGELAELILLEARARVALAGGEDDRRRALEWAVGWLDRAESFDPSPSPALFADRARYHQALGRADLARLDRARRDATPPSSARDEYLLGTADLAAGRADLAESRLARAVALDPARFWAWFALGLCHCDQGRFVDAVGDFNVCTVLAPEFAWPFANRGFALARAGRSGEAIASFDRAVALSPGFVDAIVGRGFARLRVGDAARAEADLARAIELGCREPTSRAAHAEALARLGRRDEAMSLYDELIAARPDDARLLAARGMARLRAEPAAAESDFASALGLDPTLSVAHYGLARLLQRSDPARAIEHAERAQRSDPDGLDALELLALLRARLGRPEADADVARLIRAPTPHRLYNAACALAVLARSRPDAALEARAIGLLRRAVESGFPAASARSDADFDGLRDLPEFRAVVDEAPRSGVADEGDRR